MLDYTVVEQFETLGEGPPADEESSSRSEVACKANYPSIDLVLGYARILVISEFFHSKIKDCQP